MKHFSKFAALVPVVVVRTSSADLLAYRGASRSTHVFPTRYAACREDSVPSLPKPEPERRDGMILVPVPTISGNPGRLQVVADEADDVAYSEPVPRQIETHDSQVIATSPVVSASSNDFRCLGFLRGRAGILRVLSSAPATRFYGHSYPESWRADNMVAASVANMTDAIPSLRLSLNRPLAGSRSFDRVAQKTESAIVLAALRDRSSASDMVKWLRELETISWNGLWSDVFNALVQNDDRVAEAYAIELLDRISQGTLGERVASDRLATLSALSPATREQSLPVLQRLSSASAPFDGYGHASCLLLGARIRLGDPLLVKDAREQMQGELTTNWAINCFSEVRDSLPWNEPADLAALTHRHAYEAMLLWIRLPETAESRPARQKLLAWLQKQMTSPEVSQVDHVEFRKTTRATFLAVQAALGDALARRLLREMAVDPRDETDAGWMAASYGLRYDLPGALDDARERLRLGLTQDYARGWYESPVGVGVNWPTQMMQEMITKFPSDASWTVGLLNKRVTVREWTLFSLSRIRPKGACQKIATASNGAEPDSISDAFWGLTVLGQDCVSAIEALAKNVGTASKIRGPSIEYLAMVKHPEAVAIAREAGKREELRQFARRAEIIAGSRE